MITLRPYQQTAFDDTVQALKTSKRKRGVVEMPTGGGKTVVFSHFVQLAQAKGSKTLILTDRKELLGETASTLEDFGVLPSRIRAGRKFPPKWSDALTCVAMTQTLRNRTNKSAWLQWFKDINLVIIDECHKQEFNPFFERDVFKGKTVVAFSATPKRGGKQRQLAEDYDFIVHTLTVVELIDMGFLMPEMHYNIADLSPDMKGVQKGIDGDYSESAMFKKYDTPKLYGGIVDNWKAKAPGTITLVFCVNIIHCVRTCKEFAAQGIKAKFIVSSLSKPKRPDGEEPFDKATASPEWVKFWDKTEHYDEYNEAFEQFSGERDVVLDEWKRGEFLVLINAGILTTGFNFKPIETCILARATASLVLYLQMIGRCSRPSPETGKESFTILDFGKNGERLGSYRLPRKWELYHETKGGNGTPAMKECGHEKPTDKNGKNGCGGFIFASSMICPICGYIYPEKEEPKKIELSLMSADESGKLRAVKDPSEMSFDELDKFQDQARYKRGWIYIQIFRRGGMDELKAYAQHKGYKQKWVHLTYSRLPKGVKELYI